MRRPNPSAPGARWRQCNTIPEKSVLAPLASGVALDIGNARFSAMLRNQRMQIKRLSLPTSVAFKNKPVVAVQKVLKAEAVVVLCNPVHWPGRLTAVETCPQPPFLAS